MAKYFHSGKLVDDSIVLLYAEPVNNSVNLLRTLFFSVVWFVECTCATVTKSLKDPLP